jgi:hypothetical protein
MGAFDMARAAFTEKEPDASAVGGFEPTGVVGLDCKDLSLLASEKITGLKPVAGYMVAGTVFTEHWWNLAGKKVVDSTGMSLGGGVILLPLDDQRDDPRGVCLAYEDECDYEDEATEEKACAWCRARYSLEDEGFERASLKYFWRPMMGSVWKEMRALRHEVISIRAEIERGRAKKVRGSS